MTDYDYDNGKVENGNGITRNGDPSPCFPSVSQTFLSRKGGGNDNDHDK
jgi:hypothetical protein